MTSKLVAVVFAVARSILGAYLRQRENLAFIAAWALITWAINGSALRGWAASLGIYLLVFALLGIIPQFLKARPVAPVQSPQHPNDV